MEQIEEVTFQDFSNLATATQQIADNVIGQTSLNQAFANRLVQLEAQLDALKKRMEVLMISGGLGRQNSISVGDGLALTRVLSRFKMYIDTTDLEACAGVLADGWMDLGVTNLLPALLRERMSFVDVCAGSGYYSLIAAEAVGAQGHVDAIETGKDSGKRTLQILQRNIKINGLAEEQGSCVRVRVAASLDPEEIAAALPEHFDVIRIAAGRDTLRIFDRLKDVFQRNSQAKAILDSGCGISEWKLAGFTCTRILESCAVLVERRTA